MTNYLFITFEIVILDGFCIACKKASDLFDLWI